MVIQLDTEKSYLKNEDDRNYVKLDIVIMAFNLFNLFNKIWDQSLTESRIHCKTTSYATKI